MMQLYSKFNDLIEIFSNILKNSSGKQYDYSEINLRIKSKDNQIYDLVRTDKFRKLLTWPLAGKIVFSTVNTKSIQRYLTLYLYLCTTLCNYLLVVNMH